MAVQLILGSSGAGKSWYIYHKVIEEAMAHPQREYLVIVPEQFTMQTQKELVRMHPGGGILNIDVLSFDRLAYRVFEEVGGDSRRILEETGKTLVLQKVVQRKQNQLGYLASQMKKPGYVQEMKSLISELMQYDIREDKIEEMLADAQDKALLFRKLEDVKLLYQEFRSYLQDKFLTAEEVLDVLCGKLGESEIIKKSTVVFDGFTGFTPIQYQVLEEMMELCSQIYITVTLGEQEKPFGICKPFELFAMSKQMIQSVQELAVKTKTEFQKPCRIEDTEPSRFSQSPALLHLEQHLFRYGKHIYSQKTEEIQMFSAANPLREMTEVSRRIARLIREEGYRYGEIAVITGDLETYGNYAEQVFEQAQIPYFLDRKHSVLMNPFVEYIRSALDVMIQNFSYESVFRHLRSGLTDLSTEEVDLLEEYVVALGIRGWKRWKEKWVRLYRGMNPESIQTINEIRERVMEGLSAFADEFKKRGNRVEDDARALYHYIAHGKIQEKLHMQEVQFARQGDAAMEKEYAQIYGIVMNLLDKLVEILGDEKVTQREFVQLMEAGLSEASVGIIPPSTDQVLVGDMERTRLKDIKALFFVGVNDGIIPKNSGRGGILSESDREFFAGQGISLAPTPREAMYRQRFYLYLNLTKPSLRLFLSYALADAAGKAMGPAYLIGTMEQMFPEILVENIETKTEICMFERVQDSMDYLVEGMRRLPKSEPEEAWKELYSWFVSQPEYETLIKQLVKAAFFQKTEDKISASVAKALYGEVAAHSATRLERFAACAFAHFLQYGLALSTRVEYEFTPVDMGNVMHNALETFSGKIRAEKLNWKNLTKEQREHLVKESLQSVTDDYGNTILHSSARNEYMIRRAERILNRTVWALQNQLMNGEFEPEGFEVSIGGGRIDRLDVCETDKEVLVKVIDYKTGGTTFDLLAVYHGLQLQLMVYLDGALAVEKKNHPDKEIIPAGVFYYNIKDPMIQSKAAEDVETVTGELLKKLKMNGLASSDEAILNKLDQTLESLPVSRNKNGSLSKRSQVADERQFEELRRFVNQKINNIRKEIMEGEVQIQPYELGTKNGCTYCPYSGICGFDPKIPGYEFRRLKQFSDEEIWREIARQTGGEKEWE